MVFWLLVNQNSIRVILLVKYLCANPWSAIPTSCYFFDRDQNGIKRLTPFLGADQGIKTNSERLISTDQCTFLDTKEAWLCFVLWTPLNQAIKSLEQSNQVIKDGFHRSRFLLPVANTSTGDTYVTNPWCTCMSSTGSPSPVTTVIMLTGVTTF